MKYCPKCHREYVDSLNYCTECGVPLEIKEENGRVGNIYEQHGRKKPSVRKRFFMGLAIVLAVLYLVFDFIAESTTYIRLESNEILASKSGGSTDIAFDYDGFFYSVADCPEWVEVEENESKLQISVEKNLTGKVRRGVIVIRSGKVEAKILVAQRNVATYIRTSESSLLFTKKGGTATVKIDTDGCNWKIYGPDYCSVKEVDGEKFKISLPQNDGYSRMGYITVQEDHVKKVVQFLQGGVCEQCQGKGKMICPYCKGYGNTFWGTCQNCGGTGVVQCSYCKGAGEIE